MSENTARLQELMQRDEVLIEQFISAIHQTLSDAVGKINVDKVGLIDISLSLDALLRSVCEIALDLDRAIPESEREQHYKARETMIPECLNHMDSIIEKHPSPLYFQDIYIILANVLLNYTNRNRIFSHTQNLGGNTDAGYPVESNNREEPEA